MIRQTDRQKDGNTDVTVEQPDIHRDIQAENGEYIIVYRVSSYY